jgi:hypothetical protein
MDVSAPDSLEQFMNIFSNWPEDSISQRTDRVGSGSSWGIREIGTFQVIRKPLTEETPLFLKDYWAESENRFADYSKVRGASLAGIFRHDNLESEGTEQMKNHIRIELN